MLLVSESTPTQPNFVIKMCFAPLKNTGCKVFMGHCSKDESVNYKKQCSIFFLFFIILTSATKRQESKNRENLGREYEICLIWTFCQLLVHTWAVSDLEVSFADEIVLLSGRESNFYNN